MALTFSSVTLQPVSLNSVSVTWVMSAVEPGVTYTVSRSGAPEGPWVELSAGIVLATYLDMNVNLRSPSRLHHYMVTAIAGVNSTDSDPVAVFFTPDNYATEMVRRNNILLERHIGTSCKLYSRRTWGVKCPNCWDSVKQRRTTDSCLICYSTGFLGGYYTGVDIYISFMNPPQTIRPAEITDEQQTNNSWMSNYPIVKALDVIKTPDLKCWRVRSVLHSTKLQYIIRQRLELIEIDKNAQEYKLS